MNEIHKGDIYYVTQTNYKTVGSEQYAGRPAIVVSNNSNNANSSVVEMVYLTTQPKEDLPTHFVFFIGTKRNTAICEQISTVDVSRLENFYTRLTDEQMLNLDACLMISLGIVTFKKEKPVETKIEASTTKSTKADLARIEKLENDVAELTVANIKAKAERDTYSKLYNSLLKRNLKNTGGDINVE